MTRRKVLTVMVLVPTLVVMIFVAATYALEKENRSGRLATDADRAHALLRLEIDEAAASLHAQLDILLLVKKDLLDREKWDLGERQSGGQGSWGELSNTVSVARTLATIPTAVGIALEDGLPSTSDGITD